MTTSRSRARRAPSTGAFRPARAYRRISTTSEDANLSRPLIKAGGIGEGAIPLSVGCARILHQSQGDLFAQVLLPVMLGSLTGDILLAHSLNYVGKASREEPAKVNLQPGRPNELPREEDRGRVGVTTVAAAVVTAVTLYLIGALDAARVFSFPAPVAML